MSVRPWTETGADPTFETDTVAPGAAVLVEVPAKQSFGGAAGAEHERGGKKDSGPAHGTAG